MDGDITEYFPHIDETKPGEWCKDGGIVLNCGEATVEINVYREPIDEDNPETSGTLTLHIFYDDDVLLAQTIQRFDTKRQQINGVKLPDKSAGTHGIPKQAMPVQQDPKEEQRSQECSPKRKKKRQQER